MHDGKYSVFDEAAQPVMPHANTWFDTDGPTFARGSQDGPNTEHDDQNDSDVEAVAESVNIKCPLTLLVMTDPVKSRKCPHNFEKSAIESMLLHSTTRTNGRSSQKLVKCPVCEVVSSDYSNRRLLSSRVLIKSFSYLLLMTWSQMQHLNGV